MNNDLEDMLYTVAAMICLTLAALMIANTYAPNAPPKKQVDQEIVEIKRIDNKYHDGESI